MRIPAAVCVAVLLSVGNTMAQTKNTTIKIIETGDAHGSFLPYDYIAMKPAKGSMARVCTYINRVRSRYGGNVLLVDCGDILQGSPAAYYYNYEDTGGPNIASEVMNYMQYDAQVPGNHDIEAGPAVYNKWMKGLDCRVVAGNIYGGSVGRPAAGEGMFVKSVIKNCGGVRVAVVGMITPAIPLWLDEKLWRGMRFAPVEEEMGKEVSRLVDGRLCDVVVGVLHSGWDGGIVADGYTENVAKAVAEHVDGIDVLFYGHDHTARNTAVLTDKGKRVVCLNPSAGAMMVAEATVTVTVDGDGKVVGKQVDGTLTNICGEQPDSGFMARFAGHHERIKEYVEREIGSFDTSICTNDCFFGSAPFVDFIHNIQLDVTGADISFNAPLSVNTCVEAGPVTVGDMFSLYKYDNDMYVIRMRGDEIRRYLEMSYGLWTNTMAAPDDHIMLLDANLNEDKHRHGFKNLTFNFDSAAGIDYEVNVTKPYGEKISILRMSDGRPFSEDAWYKVVVNSYRGNGGGELLTRGAGIAKSELKSRVVWQSPKGQRHYIAREIERMGVCRPKANGNWRFVPEAWAGPALERDRKLIFGQCR